MLKPFFSIVIPTKDRPWYLRQAMLSVLLQNFHDLELIVSDNCSSHETLDVVKELSSDLRIRYVRTPHEMNMCDHWEWATLKATGDYVIVLADRKLLFQGTLRFLHKLLVKHKGRFNAYSFAIRMFDEEKHRYGFTVPLKKSRAIYSEELIKSFLSKNLLSDAGDFDSMLPKSVNGIFKNEFAKNIRAQFGHYFNYPGLSTPDYGSMVINLAMTDKIFYIGRYCMLTQGELISNGRLFSSGQTQSYIKTLDQSKVLNHVPFKLTTAYNFIFNDFLLLRDAIGRKLSLFEINWNNYYATNYTDLITKKRENITPALLDEYVELFNNHLKQLPKNDVDKMEQEFKKIEDQISNPQKPKINSDNLRLHIYDFLYQKLRNHQFWSKRFGITFDTAFQAANFKAQQVSL